MPAEMVGWLRRYMREFYYITCPACGRKPGYSCSGSSGTWPFAHAERRRLWASHGELQRAVARALWERSFEGPKGPAEPGSV